MQNIVIDKPYTFVPPHHGALWPNLMRLYANSYLKRSFGIAGYDFRGLERLQASRDAGHGIMLAPNHCRPCDPMVLAKMTAQIGLPLYIMASWHLFMQSKFQTWLLPRLGAFSIYREGLDRDALKCAVQILVDAKRPLVIFPEGAISRTNDCVNPLMDGTAFIARTAAKKRAETSPAGKVVIHPVAIRYFFCGDVERTVTPILEFIEKRLSWQPQRHKSVVERIYKVGEALLTLKELEYADKPHTGLLKERLAALIDQLLSPLEAQWLHGKKTSGGITARVKALRTAILPDLVTGEISEDERAARWRQLADLYLAQQLALYPPDYLESPPTPEQLLETVERFEEDLTDVATIHSPMHVRIEIGEAIDVNPVRERGLDTDPIMTKIRADMETMLVNLKMNRPA